MIGYTREFQTFVFEATRKGDFYFAKVHNVAHMHITWEWYRNIEIHARGMCKAWHAQAHLKLE